VVVERESWHALEDAGLEENESDGDEDDDPFITSMLASLSASATASGEPARDAPAAVASEAASASRVVASTVEAPERAIAESALVQRSQAETFLEIDAAHDYPGFVWCHPAVFPESDDEEDLTLEESKEETEAAEEKDGEEPQSVASTSASLQVSCMIFTCKINLLFHLPMTRRHFLVCRVTGIGLK